MITIKVDTSGIDAMRRQLGALQSQIPFATAKALTDTAKDVQAEVRAQMPQRFTVRSPWIAKGVRVKAATKANLTAVVYDIDPFMALQESGGTKTSIHRRVFDYGNDLAIPIDTRRNKRDIVRKEDWPQNLIKPFVLTAKDGRRYLAVRSFAKRIKGGRFTIGKNVGNTSGIRLMYLLAPRVQVPPRFGFVATARAVIDRKFNINFNNALAYAIATARQ